MRISGYLGICPDLAELEQQVYTLSHVRNCLSNRFILKVDCRFIDNILLFNFREFAFIQNSDHKVSQYN